MAKPGGGDGPELGECRYCMQDVHSLKITPCKHDACLPCLFRFNEVQNSPLKCPTCKQIIPLPPGGPDALPTKFFGKLECDLCLEVKHVHDFWWCEKCIQVFCSRCALVEHSSLNHSISPWDTANGVKFCVAYLAGFGKKPCGDYKDRKNHSEKIWNFLVKVNSALIAKLESHAKEAISKIKTTQELLQASYRVQASGELKFAVEDFSSRENFDRIKKIIMKALNVAHGKSDLAFPEVSEIVLCSREINGFKASPEEIANCLWTLATFEEANKKDKGGAQIDESELREASRNGPSYSGLGNPERPNWVQPPVFKGGNQLVVKNIPHDITKRNAALLADFFAQYGKVTKVRIPFMSSPMQPKAFVTFDDPLAVKNVLDKAYEETKALSLNLHRRRTAVAAAGKLQMMFSSPTAPGWHYLIVREKVRWEPEQQTVEVEDPWGEQQSHLGKQWVSSRLQMQNTGARVQQMGRVSEQQTRSTSQARQLARGPLADEVHTTAASVPGLEPLTKSMLTLAEPQVQKQMLGERIFPFVQRFYPELAGIITRMLLEIHNDLLLLMLWCHDLMKLWVEEAVACCELISPKLEAPWRHDEIPIFLYFCKLQYTSRTIYHVHCLRYNIVLAVIRLYDGQNRVVFTSIF